MIFYKKILILLLISYFAICLFMFLFQRTFMYHPDINSYDETGIQFEFKKVEIPSTENIVLNSWYSFKNSNYKTLVFFHGNAGNLNNRIYKLNKINQLNLNFLIISWRGFSGNQGKPTEDGLYQDAKSSIRWLEQKGIIKTNIILYGESLGTGVALELAKDSKYAGIILESPYTSMVAMAKKIYPFLPVSILVKDRFESLSKIKKNVSPILIMHGEMDTLVPAHMGKKLFQEANNPKYSYFPSSDDHMMKYDIKLVSVLRDFISAL